MRCAPLVLALVLVAPLAGAHPETPDCATGVEAGDNYFSATLIRVPRDCDAQLNDTWDSTDFYKLDCPIGKTVTATLTSASRSINLRAYAPATAPYVLPPPLAQDSTVGDGQARVRFTCYAPGQYRLQILNGGLDQDQLDIPYHLNVV